jgi:hypothetical protein
MRILRTFILLWLALEAPAETAGHPLFERIEEVTQKLSEITGLAVKRPVPYAMIDRKELKEFLEQRIREEVKPEDIRIEETLLKKFGLAPVDFDLKKTTIELYTEQAAAFYDFQRKKLFILESADRALQEAALTHELAHALADQHFRLRKFLDRAGKNDDGALARMAVMEGQASWLMAELMVRGMGQSLENSPEMVEIMSRMIGAAGGESSVYDSAPLYIRESLIFPYTAGMKFQQAVIQRMGKKGFLEVFRRPPASTQQVLHPVKYFEGTAAERVELPDLWTRREYRTLAEGNVGEFDYAVLIRQYVDEEATRRIAPGWRGASYRLLEHKRDKRTVLAQASRWETAETAQRFLEAYREALKGKWNRMEVTGESAERIAGRGDDGFFLLRRDGPHVYSLEGLAAAEEAR